MSRADKTTEAGFMKLLFCPACWDIFKLDYDPRQCKCGKTTGHYVDNVNAVTNGQGISLAIGNSSLADAVHKLCAAGEPHSRRNCINDFRVEYCWVRPNEGTGNPHTRVVSDEEGSVPAGNDEPVRPEG